MNDQTNTTHMTTQIRCPQCGKLFEPTDAYKHELEEKLLSEAQAKHQKEIELLKSERQEFEESKKKEFEEVKKQIVEKAKSEAQESVTRLLKDKEEQILEFKKRAEHAEEEELKIRKEKRELEEAKQRFEIEKQRQLDEERTKIRDLVLKEAQEKHELKDAEKEKKLQDALKMNDELKRKLEQGSQQAQGEVMELELEQILRREFPEDKISEIKKGERGADISQTVIDRRDRDCGTILWESKNAQWKDEWLKKLKEDQRAAGAELAVLVVANPPKDLDTFVYKENVWISTLKSARGLAMALRFDLIHIHFEKLANVGKNEKMEFLYQYLRSAEFTHRIEAIVEAFNSLQGDLEKEKRWFSIKWSRQEKELRKIVENTYGMYGELQAVTGRELQEIKPLELPEPEE